MPTYQYYCTDNHQTLEVIHGMTATVATWGELCDIAEHDPGNTPTDSPVEKLMGTGMVMPQTPDPEDARNRPVKSCGCGGPCHH
ncbi:MAG: zinc ribbon domain-containing protein [Planctomycetota bacterium]